MIDTHRAHMVHTHMVNMEAQMRMHDAQEPVF